MMWKPYHTWATAKCNSFATFGEICSEEHQTGDAFLVPGLSFQDFPNQHFMQFKNEEGEQSPQNC